ncbi:MAG: cell division protein ZapB [Bryobacteraceae bacterium]
MSPAEQHEDSLSSLEERVTRAVQLVSRLRQEKEAAQREAAEARAEAARLAEHVKSLEADRKQVRGRIEKLLATIDQLSA